MSMGRGYALVSAFRASTSSMAIHHNKFAASAIMNVPRSIRSFQFQKDGILFHPRQFGAFHRQEIMQNSLHRSLNITRVPETIHPRQILPLPYPDKARPPNTLLVTKRKNTLLSGESGSKGPNR
jgi:hypothetical protein